MPNPSERLPASFLSPRYWLTWLGLGLLRLLIVLPLSWQRAIGRAAGLAVMALAPRRRQIAETNIRLALPELTEAERRRLVREHFAAAGIGVLEGGLAWWGSEKRLRPLADIEGLEHLQAALAAGRGVMVVGGHFTCLEMAGRLMAPLVPVHVLYRVHENPVFEYMLRRNRQRCYRGAIAREDMRGMLRVLRKGEIVWYAPDQNFGHKPHSVFAPFFGIPAATTTSTHRLAKVSGAAVVPVFFHRTAEGRYKIILLPALENFPTEDATADTTLINSLLERYVRMAPEQYFWMHRRYKDRPPGEPGLYDRKRA